MKILLSIETTPTEKRLYVTFFLDKGTYIFIRLGLVLDLVNEKKLGKQAKVF